MFTVLGRNIQRGACCRKSADGCAVPEQSVSYRRDGCRPVSPDPRDDRQIGFPPFQWKSAAPKINSMAKEDFVATERIIFLCQKTDRNNACLGRLAMVPVSCWLYGIFLLAVMIPR